MNGILLKFRTWCRIALPKLASLVAFCIAGCPGPSGGCAGGEPSYCGIYAVYGAAIAEGLDVPEFSQLIDARFVSTVRGSTVEDLQNAAEFLGLHTFFADNASLVTLKASNHPVVLHVASHGQWQRLDHWQLFLGFADGQVRLLDEDGQVFIQHPAELLGRWDGTAIVLSSKPLGGQAFLFRALEIATRLSLATALLAACALVYRLPRVLGSSGNGHPQIVILLATVGFVIAWVSLAPCTLAESRREIDRSFAVVSFDTVQLQDLNQMPNAKLIDARYDSSFDRLHMPGAVNIPVNAGQRHIEEFKALVDADVPLVVYCQSAGCTYDEIVARRLFVAGFRNISLLEEGIAEWASAGQTVDQ